MMGLGGGGENYVTQGKRLKLSGWYGSVSWEEDYVQELGHAAATFFKHSLVIQ
jgi:hypothetical protein